MSPAPHPLATAGSLVLVEGFRYSHDYPHGLFTVARTFDPREALLAFLAARPAHRHRYVYQPGAFLQWLLEHEFLTPVAYGRLYLGRSSPEEATFRPTSEEDAHVL